VKNLQDRQGMDKQRLARVPLVFLGITALLLGIWGGLQRMGWPLPSFNPYLSLSHGQLMIGGFLGTVIGLERAVVTKKIWAYMGPFATGIGSLLIITETSPIAGAVLMTAGSGILVAMFGRFMKTSHSLHLTVMAAGALFWLCGNIFWLAGFAISNILMWWMGFLVLTIAGERLELSRLLKITKRKRIHFLFGLTLIIFGVFIATFRFAPGVKLSGFGMLVLALWLLLYDLARRSLRQTGLPRYIALALLIGYFWLGIGGFLAFFNTAQQAGPLYDAMLHSVLIGFVFSMIFAHAPLIFPAILKVKMTFRITAYFPLALLHLSLILRVTADLSGSLEGRLLGGMLNGIAIVLFFVNTVLSVSRSQV
jgi:hypothetical protein